MLYSEAKRLRFRWRILATVLVLAIGGMFLFPNIAYGTTWPGPDDGSGNYAHCNLWIFNNGSTNAIIGFACQYTLGTGGVETTNVIQNNNSGKGIQFTGGTCTGCASNFTATEAFGTGWTGSNSAGHALRDVTALSKTDNNITAASFTGCSVWFNRSGLNGIPTAASPSGVGVPCIVDSIALNQQPNGNLPTNPYPGATAGPALDSTQGTSVCSRTLTGTSDMTAEYQASRTGMAHATVTTWSWAWGDGTTAGTTAPPVKHTFGALSTQPADGWTTTVTMTLTADSGHLFADGTSTKTGTCSMRVDFLHPDQNIAGSSGGGTGSTGDTGLDACLPSGWSTLNPLAWVGGLGCVIKYLFIPQSSTITALGHTWDTATTKLPFSVVYDAVTYIPEQLDDFQYAINLPPSSAAFFCQGTWGNYFCAGHTTPFYGTDFGGGSGGHTVPATVTVTRDIVLFLIIVVFVYSCWRGAGEILK